MAFSAGTSSTYSEINITPLIDVLLVLLIIFMVIVPVDSRGLDSRVPQPSSQRQQAVEPAQPLVVEVLAGADGAPAKLRLNSRDVANPAGLEQALAAALGPRQDRTVFIRADRSLTFAPVAQVVGSAKAAGAFPIALLGPEAADR